MTDFMEETPAGGEYLKAFFMGEEKSGKTFTAVELALHLRATFGLDGPIAGFDTERWTGTRMRRVSEATGKPLMRKRSRTLKDAVTFIEWCVDNGVSVAIIDSVSHLWTTIQDDYLRQANDKRKKKGKYALDRIPISSWQPIKQRWREFMDAYLQSPLHIIMCSRAKEDYEIREGGEMEKTGKMKAQTEKGSPYEAHLSVLMSRRHEPGEFAGQDKIIQRAWVMGDRFDVMGGHAMDFPDGEFFQPHLDALGTADFTPMTPGENKFEIRESNWDPQEKQRADGLRDRIKQTLVRWCGGQKKEDKVKRIDAVKACFGTVSMEELKPMRSDELEAGFYKLEHYIEKGEVPPDEPELPADEVGLPKPQDLPF